MEKKEMVKITHGWDSNLTLRELEDQNLSHDGTRMYRNGAPYAPGYAHSGRIYCDEKSSRYYLREFMGEVNLVPILRDDFDTTVIIENKTVIRYHIEFPRSIRESYDADISTRWSLCVWGGKVVASPTQPIHQHGALLYRVGNQIYRFPELEFVVDGVKHIYSLIGGPPRHAEDGIVTDMDLSYAELVRTNMI